jgi:glycosyltransferase involved in cell wall biosynthesis
MHQAKIVKAIPQIAIVGSYVPRRCGIATFSHDLRAALEQCAPRINCQAIAVSDQPGAYRYPDEVRFEIDQHDAASYGEAATYLNASHIGAVSLQHEFGIFGGPAGAHIIEFVSRLHAPLITTLHTVLANPEDDQRRVMEELIQHSASIVVMAAKGRQILEDVYAVPADKIAVIPHGIPDHILTDSETAKHALGFGGRTLAMTFGLISPGKGIETMIAALPQLIRKNPELVYVVVGATHPQLRAIEGEKYRDGLCRLAAELGVGKHLHFIDQYVDLADLLQLLAACDVYVTPYLNEAQICSGTLAYAVGLGKPVVSTPYWHAQELLAEGRGMLVSFGDTQEMADAVGRFLTDPGVRRDAEQRAFALGRTMTWPAVARRYRGIMSDMTNAAQLPEQWLFQPSDERLVPDRQVHLAERQNAGAPRRFA